MISKIRDTFNFIKSYVIDDAWETEVESSIEQTHSPKPKLSVEANGLQNDYQLLVRGHKMIYPFIPLLCKQPEAERYPYFPRNVISYGLSSFGYDIRLSDEDFYIFKHLPGKIVDPKDFDVNFLEKQSVEIDSHTGETYFIIPANSYALGVSLEHFMIPEDTLAICMTKSTYARAGIFVNTTPLEPGWAGHLTIEIANCSSSDVKVYANEGIGQLLFFKGNKPSVTYADRNGKYMNQEKKVVVAKV